MDKPLFTSLELEESILSRCISDKKAYPLIANILEPEDFYYDYHKTLFKTIVSVADKGMDVDWLSIKAESKKHDTGDIKSIISLSIPKDHKVKFGDIISWAQIVSRLRYRRDFIDKSNEVILKMHDESIDNHQLHEKFSESLESLSSKSLSVVRTNADISKALRKRLRDVQNGLVVDTPLTGISDLDKYMTIANGEMMIIAARPAMGKSMLANTIVCNVGHRLKKKVVVWTLEMSDIEYSMMCMSNIGEINYSDFRQSKVDYSSGHYQKAEDDFVNSGISIIDEGGVTIRDIEARATYMKHKGELDVLIVDHGKLIRVENKDYRIGVNDISARMKQLAKKLDIPVVLLWQLSRKAEEAPNHEPQLSHLQETGNLEQDADRVIMILRPDYYDDFDKETFPDMIGKAFIFCRKYRGGETGHAKASFRPLNARFESFDQGDLKFRGSDLPSYIEPQRLRRVDTEEEEIPF